MAIASMSCWALGPEYYKRTEPLGGGAVLVIGPPITHNPCGCRHLRFILYPSKYIDLWSKRLSAQFLLPSVSSLYLPEGRQQNFIIQVECQYISVQFLLGSTGQPFSMVRLPSCHACHCTLALHSESHEDSTLGIPTQVRIKLAQDSTPP